ncbi:FadR/GntR family transcriptional regulator [Actinoplanes awajinensis]|uniref:GntR family transcriptional regulator n=1 Tax=Actinoplanes awajinensis subsp. mycoplanecinus TaxID=135947 RepID=A0A101JMH5_9ACTN|nr:FadR/GntR family transcriptional regulator [Actinoplanes awajinensis]KUL29536.1 GntR family transcriptional regulator [Actinoplanes awajinensis subsp. mycoplanecinus]
MTGSVVRPPAYQQLADDLRADITSGRLQPGERLPPEPELCVKIGVSRSTVREALRLLASQHLIVTTRGVTGGSFVAHPDAGQLAEGLSTGFTLLTHSAGVGMADLLELRRALEVPAAGLAAVRRTESHLAELRGALFDPLIDDLDTMLAAHSAFHRALVKATGNPLFELVGRPLYQASYGEELVRDLPADYWHQIDADHRQLLAELAAQDASAATGTAVRHLDYIALTTSTPSGG